MFSQKQREGVGGAKKDEEPGERFARQEEG